MVRRRRRTEAQSVAGYRQTLDVLGHLGGTERTVRAPTPDRGEGTRPPPHEAGSSSVPGRRLVVAPSRFDDLGANQRPRATDEPGEVLAHRDRSLVAMEHPARRLGAPLAALAILVVAAAVVAFLALRPHRSVPPKPKTISHSHSHTPAPTTTTLPASYTAVTSTSSTATYAPPSATYTLTIGATTAPCWMSVTSATGTTELAQTFSAGATATLTLTGHATIDIGAPASAKLSIGSVPVVLPAGAAGPFTVTIVPG